MRTHKHLPSRWRHKARHTHTNYIPDPALVYYTPAISVAPQGPMRLPPRLSVVRLLCMYASMCDVATSCMQADKQDMPRTKHIHAWICAPKAGRIHTRSPHNHLFSRRAWAKHSAPLSQINPGREYTSRRSEVHQTLLANGLHRASTSASTNCASNASGPALAAASMYLCVTHVLVPSVSLDADSI